jgi:plastocyanin
MQPRLPERSGRHHERSAARRIRRLCTVAACATVMAAGCGSTGSSKGTSAPTRPSTTAPTPTTSGGLKASTAPKFASPPASAPVRGGTVQITYRNIAIDPDTARVKVGSTIRWTNYDSVEHNVTSEGGPILFASKNLGEGRTFEVKVTAPGVIHYECTIHPTTMNGSIDAVK